MRCPPTAPVDTRGLDGGRQRRVPIYEMFKEVTAQRRYLRTFWIRDDRLLRDYTIHLARPITPRWTPGAGSSDPA
ncbi:hypothetical protein N9L68_00795 [bacterium]|nr:hypothetical protein [bacterium]